ncbi:MAG: HD domain-containing protein [Clostridiales bacterium]|nr:HD domain-containing protein [Clostridiales bacterium]
MDFNKYLEFIKEKHAGQTRKHGAPYYTHPMAVADILKNKGFSDEYIIVGLFHDLLEDTNTTFEEILSLTNLSIANAVKLLTKEKGYIMEEYIEGIRNNPIAKMVKLADRIHNLSEANLASLKFQEKYIKETKDWYIDLAKGTVFEEDLIEVLRKLENN